jgi:hypothetical protein
MILKFLQRFFNGKLPVSFINDKPASNFSSYGTQEDPIDIGATNEKDIFLSGDVLVMI